MPRKAFRTVVGHMLWKEEYRRRFQLCVASARLARIADELTRLAEEESGEGLRRTRWPGAPYLQFVDSKFPLHLMAIARLGTLPAEVETGRWEIKTRAERLCRLGCQVLGDIDHFLGCCAAITAETAPSLIRKASTASSSSSLELLAHDC